MANEERDALLASLNAQREHLLGALDGLSEEDLRRPVLPSMPWMSLPQMPQAATLSSTSSGPISGCGQSWISK